MENCDITDEWMDNCSLDDPGACAVRETSSKSTQCLANTLQAGTSLVASGYCLFSSSCVFVLTLGAGTHGFTLNREVGEFVLTHPDIHIPTRGKISSFNQV